MEELVKLKAIDSFNHAPLGMVPARTEFEAPRAVADDLIERGLATEIKVKAPAAKRSK